MSEQGYGIDAEAFRKAAQALEKEGFDRAAGRTLAYGLRQSGNAIRRKVRAELRPHRRTGKMISNVRVKVVGWGMNQKVGVRATGSGSNLIAGGVRPHAITRDGGAMPIWAGKGKSAGITGFATAVQHPGFPGDPFFERGIHAAGPEVNAILQKSAETMAKELAYRMHKGSR
jgi:hypothetical protein